MTPIVVIDTETTGIQHTPWTRVIEFAAVMVAEGEIVSTFHSMVWPDMFNRERSKHAMAANGIAIDEFRAAPKVGEVDQKFRQWWLEHGNPPCTAWPIAFEDAVLSMSGFAPFHWGPCIKTAFKAVYGGNPSPHAAAERLGVTPEFPVHRALPDARTEAKVWIAHCNQMGL